MGIATDFFAKRLGKLNVDKTTNNYKVNINYTFLGRKIDHAQEVLDLRIWNDIKQYMPVKSGRLIDETERLNLKTRGEVYLYPPDLAYGHYQYEGKVYVDPVYGVGAFTDGKGNFWSRRGIKKVESDRPLFYTNPMAEAHWDEIAKQNHYKQWVDTARKAIK